MNGLYNTWDTELVQAAGKFCVLICCSFTGNTLDAPAT